MQPFTYIFQLFVNGLLEGLGMSISIKYVVSSINRTKFNFCEEFGILLINIRNTRGPSTEPRATPHGRISILEINKLISVVRMHFNRYI